MAAMQLPKSVDEVPVDVAMKIRMCKRNMHTMTITRREAVSLKNAAISLLVHYREAVNHHMQFKFTSSIFRCGAFSSSPSRPE